MLFASGRQLLAAETPHVMFCFVKVLPHLTTIVQPDVSDFGQTNGCLQQIAANRLSTPQDVIAILLQGLVRPVLARFFSHGTMLASPLRLAGAGAKRGQRVDGVRAREQTSGGQPERRRTNSQGRTQSRNRCSRRWFAPGSRGGHTRDVDECRIRLPKGPMEGRAESLHRRRRRYRRSVTRGER
jgi:hypothetical protein